MSLPSPPSATSAPSLPSMRSLPLLPQNVSLSTPPWTLSSFSGAVERALRVQAGRVRGVGLAVADRAVRHPDEHQALVALRRRVIGDEAGDRSLQVGELELAVRGAEHVGLEALRVRVAHDQLGERVALELRAQVEARRPVQVVEAVAVLQVGQLLLEDVVERRAEQAAEQVLRLGQAADPEVDVVEPGDGLAVGGVRPRAGAVDEFGRVGRRVRDGRVVVVDEPGGGPLGVRGRRVLDGRVLAVGGHEVDHRLLVLEAEPVVHPVGVGLQRAVVRGPEQLLAQVVQRRDAGLAGPRHVQRRQVQRQAEQVVAQRLGDELVELVADLVGHAHDDAAGRLLGRERPGAAAVLVGGRVQERVEEREVVGASVLVGARHRVGQHRVPEPVHGVGELGLDRRVDVGLSGDLARGERVDRRAGSCERTPRRPGAGTPSRSRSARPGRSARRSIRRRRRRTSTRRRRCSGR